MSPQIIKVPALVDGIVGDVKVKSGQQVQPGETLAVQVQTKAEYQVKATAPGRVKSIVEKGQTLKAGQTVAEIET